MLSNRSSDAEAFLSAHDEFDFVIVGGGTAGLTLAARLSEDPNVTVAVLESGGDGRDDARIDTPGMFGAGLMTEHDWKLHSEPGSGVNEGVPATYWPRGNVLGGSSALNFLVWDRCSSIELDGWEQLGNPGWNWSNLYHYMKKAEHFHQPSAEVAAAYHMKPNAADYGDKGPVQVSFSRYISEQATKWIPALESLGIPRNDHSLAGNNTGASCQPSIIDPVNGSKRSYSASAYLYPNLGRKNLKVLTGVLCHNIEWAAKADGGASELTATGVTFSDKAQRPFTLRAKREVILCAGTVMTPALLERSGIGSKSVLSAAGVPLQVELPGVGENLQDHTYAAMSFELKEGHVTLDSMRNDPAFAAEQQALYKTDGAEGQKGSLLTQTVPTVAYLSLEQLVGVEHAQQLVGKAEKLVMQNDKPYKETMEKQLEWLQKFPDKVGQMEVIGVDGFFCTNGAPEPGKTYLTLMAAQQHLFSRGSIHITSRDATVHPTIHTGYFSEEWDLDVATAGTEMLQKIAATEQYAELIAKQAVPAIAAESTDLREYTRTIGTTTEYHPTSTASMLPRDKGGVVNPDLVVYGVKNVRVVDASIFPLNISAHIQATVYGVSEAAADIIKRQHNLHTFSTKVGVTDAVPATTAAAAGVRKSVGLKTLGAQLSALVA